MRGDALRPFATGRDVAGRPLVFVARGTHAAYALPCGSSSCDSGTVLEDTRHDGAHEWPEEACSPQGCVTAFPQPMAGDRVASWNAFDGHWGSAICITQKFYCARANAPQAPGQQPRYKRPWCYDFMAGADLRHPHPVKLAGC
jgi:hypothetical protein